MGFVKEMEGRNTLYEAKFYNKIVTSSSGKMSYSFPSSPFLTVDKVVFWTGPAAERIVSSKFKVDVSGVINLDYEDYTTEIKEGDKAVINDVEYSVMCVDNVNSQNMLIQIPVKKLNG